MRSLADIRATADRATPGTWSADPTGTVCADADLITGPDGTEILPESGPMEVAECYRNERPDERADNAAFIAAARQDVPDLLDLVERQQTEIERLRAQVDAMGYRLASQRRDAAREMAAAERNAALGALDEAAEEARYGFGGII